MDQFDNPVHCMDPQNIGTAVGETNWYVARLGFEGRRNFSIGLFSLSSLCLLLSNDLSIRPLTWKKNLILFLCNVMPCGAGRIQSIKYRLILAGKEVPQVLLARGGTIS